MELSTPVILPESCITLDVESRVMFVGSCFAEHVGTELQHMMGEDMVDVNPFGVLYNPESIGNAVELLCGEANVSQHVFQGQDGVWHSWLFTSHYSGETREDCIAKTNTAIRQGREHLKKTDLLCVTFGTTRCYKLADGTVVANCHKEPQSRFTEYEPSLMELISMWKGTLQTLREYNPTLHVCFTVSPYRYKKYGFHESQIQKAKLLLLIDALSTESNVSYFPAYEIMMDELRDYRFYASDMLHPSDLAVSIITERFVDWTFTNELKEQSKVKQKEWRRSQHRTIVK